MRVRLTQLDGSLPNIALMRLSHWHKAQGDTVHFSKSVFPELWEPKEYDRVYASALFHNSADNVGDFLREWPEAIVGGTWNHAPGQPYTGPRTESYHGVGYANQDYALYPSFDVDQAFVVDQVLWFLWRAIHGREEPFCIDHRSNMAWRSTS